jgi:maleylpyruvate isomerase
VKLYSYWRSSSAWRVRTVLELKGVAYEYVPVDIAPGTSAQERDEYAAVNPLRQVPVLEWLESGELVRLTQSVAIAEYLEERFPEPPLLPAAPLARARVREAVEIVNSGIQPLQNTRTLAWFRQASGEEGATRWAKEAIVRGLDALEELAAAHGGRYLVGGQVSLADVYLAPQLYNARRFGFDLSPYTQLQQVEENAGALDAFRRARPERQPDAP